MRIIIIGAGPGGYETAVAAAKRGIEVTLINKGPLGGTCLNAGCIPTKTFIACKSLEEARARKTEVLETLRSGIAGLLSDKLITLVEGTARFVSDHTVDVDGVQYSADKIIIATGSVPAFLPVEGAGNEGVLDSTAILDLDEVPQRLCIIGGGVIGLEFASIFSAFGSEVTVLEYAKNILPRFDTDLAKRLKQSLSKKGIKIENSAQVTSIDKDLTVHYLKNEQEFTVPADKVLMAVGRKASFESLNPEAAGIVCDRRGICVDENMQTNVPGVYAIGDVNGRMMLAHVATFQGRRALNHICGQTDKIRFDIVPSAVFTDPEAACVGMTEEEAKEKELNFRCLKSFYRANGKAVASGTTDGYCKLIVDCDSDKILGCHIFGAHASDIIQEATVLLNFESTLSDFENIIHAHPSLPELLQTAAYS